jgi:hypothetical protein
MSNCSPKTGHSIGLQDALNNKIGKLPRLTAFGRVEPMTTQGCLPKSCHSLNLGIESFVGRLNGRFGEMRLVGMGDLARSAKTHGETEKHS